MMDDNTCLTIALAEPTGDTIHDIGKALMGLAIPPSAEQLRDTTKLMQDEEMSEKPPRKKREKVPAEQKRLTEQQLAFMGDIFPGFDTWYRENFDEQGKRIPGTTNDMPTLNSHNESKAANDQFMAPHINESEM